jgi:UDP-N-acetylglucosamine 1-carboxyvinyltransferase
MDDEFQSLIRSVEAFETNNFYELANLLGRDPKKDYSGADLSSTDLSGGDLRYANLSYTNLSGANLSSCDLSYADLSGADLTNTNLTDAILIGAKLTNTDLNNAILDNAQLDATALVGETLLQKSSLYEDDNVRLLHLSFAESKNTVVAEDPIIIGESRTEELVIEGPNLLCGEINISGSKNSALVLMAACLLTGDSLKLRNVPQLTDIVSMGEILSALGVQVTRSGETIELSANHITRAGPPYELLNSLRASFFCIGPLLARMGTAQIPLPGGCQIGARPVVEHVAGLKKLGAELNIQHGVVRAVIPRQNGRLLGGQIDLSLPSVGATETLMMAAALAEGETIINNAAMEPEVVDLAGLLLAMGADIRGAGSNTIVINGVHKLHGADYTVMPDRIEAGTYLIAAAITRSSLLIKPVISEHLRMVLDMLEECGCTLQNEQSGLRITANEIKALDFRTQPFPGFPTDLQAPFMSLLATAQGTSLVVENIFENRMQHVTELQRMGASIRSQGNTACVEGVPQLSGAPVQGTDLRASAAMVLAGLAAQGTTTVRGLEYLDRGYERMERKLKYAGASIMRRSLRSDPVLSLARPTR